MGADETLRLREFKQLAGGHTARTRGGARSTQGHTSDGGPGLPSGGAAFHPLNAGVAPPGWEGQPSMALACSSLRVSALHAHVLWLRPISFLPP